MENNFVKRCIADGGSLHPLILPADLTRGTGLMNPSVFIDDDGKILVNIRHVNYTFYHSEKKLFQHPWGPLIYVHPEDDQNLRTWNYYCELNEDLEIKKFALIDTSKLDVEPIWEFVGLEDARLVRWDGDLYITGVRRDTTTNGQGRMELSKLEVTEDYVKEVSRVRIEAPNNPDSYCEKNWMPVLDQPFTFVKWTNPTEVVKANHLEGTSETIFLGEEMVPTGDLRGGSQLIPYEDNFYIAVLHEVDLFKSDLGRKDGKYWHRFVVWDKDWNIHTFSEPFFFLDGQVEFSVGMARYKEGFLITFGFTDNAAFILYVKKNTIENFLNRK